MIRIKRVYEAAVREDGTRVLVDRVWPRGMKKDAARVVQWMRELGPSDELRRSLITIPLVGRSFANVTGRN